MQLHGSLRQHITSYKFRQVCDSLRSLATGSRAQGLTTEHRSLRTIQYGSDEQGPPQFKYHPQAQKHGNTKRLDCTSTHTHLFGKADNRGLDGADAAPHRRRLDLNQLRRAGAVIRRQVLHQELKRRASPPQHRERGTNTRTRCGRENVREAAQRLR